MKKKELHIVHKRFEGEGGMAKTDISLVGCLPKADTRRQGEGGGVKNLIFEETSFMDVPLCFYLSITKLADFRVPAKYSSAHVP